MSRELLEVRLKPGASRTAILSVDYAAGAAAISVTARPVQNAANRALVSFLADTLGIPQSRIAIVRGQTATRKHLKIEGFTVDQICELLAASISGSF